MPLQYLAFLESVPGLQAVELIKKAILQSQYNAIRLANQEQLKLYFGIGRYISENSRNGFWGTGAVEIISAQLKNDLPGLMGFGVTSLKNMRKFYEAWATIKDKSATAAADLQVSDSEPIAIRQPQLANYEGFPLEEFLAVPFTHHIRIHPDGLETVIQHYGDAEQLHHHQCNQEHRKNRECKHGFILYRHKTCL